MSWHVKYSYNMYLKPNLREYSKINEARRKLDKKWKVPKNIISRQKILKSQTENIWTWKILLELRKVLINNMKKLDPEGEFMSCFGSTDPVTGKHKERLKYSLTQMRHVLIRVGLSWKQTECKPANPDDVDMDRLFIAQDSPAHTQFGGEPVCNGPWLIDHESLKMTHMIWGLLMMKSYSWPYSIQNFSFSKLLLQI